MCGKACGKTYWHIKLPHIWRFFVEVSLGLSPGTPPEERGRLTSQHLIGFKSCGSAFVRFRPQQIRATRTKMNGVPSPARFFKGPARILLFRTLCFLTFLRRSVVEVLDPVSHRPWWSHSCDHLLCQPRFTRTSTRNEQRNL